MAGEREPASAHPLVSADAATIPWADARRRLADARWYWVATNRPDGQPHVRPVLAVWDGCLVSTTNRATRKGRNLAVDQRVTVTVASDDLHLVVEGGASWITDADRLEWIAAGYASKYGWPVEVRDGAFVADGAPTAGPPPYAVYEVVPTTIYAFGASDADGPSSTRWRF